MRHDQKYRYSDTAIARKVGDDTVILDMASGTYFGLDPIGARIWELIGEQRSFKDICSVMLAEFDVSEERLNADVIGLLNDLLAQKLLMKMAAGSGLVSDEAVDET